MLRKALFKSLNQAVEDNRPLAMIVEKRTQLTEFLVAYSKNCKKNNFDLVEIEDKCTRPDVWFWSKLTRSKSDAPQMKNLYNHNQTNIVKMIRAIVEAEEKVVCIWTTFCVPMKRYPNGVTLKS